MLKKAAKRKGLWLLFLIIIIVAVMFEGRRSYFALQASPTEQFIKRHMMNANGTLATFLQEGVSDTPEIPAGREALSESLGLWMQYAVLKDDKALFESGYETLKQWFVAPEGYIAWKLTEDGQSMVHTNALVDDFRIIEALYEATYKWNREAYGTLADQLSSTVTDFLLREGTFVDYYDFSLQDSGSNISLSYLNMPAMAHMVYSGELAQSVYQRHKALLKDMPNDGRFYPKSYDPVANRYTYDDTINLIDQLLVALNVVDNGGDPAPLFTFIQTEFTQRQQIMGRYSRAGQPVAPYESPAVYGLSILLALRLNDVEFASQLYDRMLKFRGQDHTYPGGYVFDRNTHLFDNLYPLIAEQQLLEQTRGKQSWWDKIWR
ncbi:hypothetical protein [Paenibacillus sanguinis]|uniref:hypothetical protein n=1 Tax=Paenibacillus sanguinis TaxID=225906 RepID=UPI000362E2A6|nr:hypothetical protein [Paenibacillus sanguinis]